MFQRYENLVLDYVYIYECYCIEKNSKCNFTKLLHLGIGLGLIGAGEKRRATLQIPDSFNMY